jgi:cytochrome P450/NADPH-cytochrome P450 reductase
MEDASHFEPIPRPLGHMLVGNLFDVDTAHPLEGLAELARKYGPIYKLEVPGLGSRIIASSFDLVDPLCDESRFDKLSITTMSLRRSRGTKHFSI